MKPFILCGIAIFFYFLTSGQNVGVGISNPAFKLDVRNGSINVDSVYRISTVTVLATPGNGNLYVGMDAGKITTGANNTFTGNLSGKSNTTGYYNSFYGYNSGFKNTVGLQNSFFGQYSGSENTSGQNNSFFGGSSGLNNTTGSYNSFFGAGTGYNNTTATYNSYFGLAAGYYTTTGSNNSFFGESTAYYNVTGSENSFFGKYAGLNNNGNYNTAHGFSSLIANTTGIFNTAIGYKANILTGTQNNATAIGALARTDCNNCLILGSVAGINEATSGVNVGIGTTSPLALLHVQDSSVIFSAAGDLPFNPGSLPTLGVGSRMIWYPGKAAFRAGFVDGNQWDQDNIGLYSFAAGSNTIASESYSTALGWYADATGIGSTALGISAEASGESSTAIGTNALASGLASTSIGFWTQALNFSASAFGNRTRAAGISSMAFGKETEASGENATTMGYLSIASGLNSTALGYFTNASGENSTAIGDSTAASGLYSVAMGSSSIASGVASTTGGLMTTAKGVGSTSFGTFNDNSDTPDEFIPAPTDRLFQIGNGDDITRSNAFTVLRNSNTGIGITTPAFPLTFAPLIGEKIGLWYDGNSNGNTYGIGIASGLLQIHTDVDYADIAFGYGSSANLVETMRIKGNGNVGIGTNAPSEKLEVNGNIMCTVLIQTSDARLKKDLVPIENSLDRISQIHGYNYNWIDPSMGTSLQSGVMGQELQKLFPELVHEDEQGQLSVNYSGLIPVLIESIKEQQRQIDELKSIVDQLAKQ